MPTARQEAAVLETIKVLKGESTLNDGQIAEKCGYGKDIQENPHKLKRTKSWQELMNKYFPDAKIAKSVNLLLEKKETRIEKDKKGKTKVIRTKEIDANAVAKGVEFAAKMKGKYQDEPKLPESTTVNITQNILNVINKAEEEVKKALIDNIGKDE